MFKDAKVRILSLALLVISMVCMSSVTLAQTGRITGRIVDGKTKKPLGYANIVIVGTTKGAMSLDNGEFTVTGVPVGSHTVKAMMMGYKTIERTIVVNANQDATINFTLAETIVAEMQRIDVFAERKMVEVTSSDVRQSVTEDQVKEMPVDNAIDAIALKTGIVKMGDDLHARGGRSGEIQMQIDGVPVNDPLGAGSIRVGQMGESSAEIISGGMDAEYGNAQSGVININTKEGGSVFAGEFRYMTDDFGRQDKTYTNFDRISLGFGGPTPWRSLRYYVSTEASFLDGENNTIEPRKEHRITDWLKARERMQHSLNVQSKLTWNQSPFKVTGEAIYQRSRFEQFFNNWNVKGYVQKVYYFQRLIPTGTGQDVFTFGSISFQYDGPWLQTLITNDPDKPGYDPSKLHARQVVVEQVVRCPMPGPDWPGRYPDLCKNKDGQTILIVHTKFRAVRLTDSRGREVDLLWDEAITDGGGQLVGRKNWILFEGFQTPFSEFQASLSGTAADTAYQFFNSATRTPEINNQNLQLKIAFNHNITDYLLYTLNLSRLEFNRMRTVDGKQPVEYSTAGLRTVLPEGDPRGRILTNRVWNTDQNFPYFVTAYDYPRFSDRKSVQWLLKSDVTSEVIEGHRIKTGIQILQNKLDEDDRFFPGTPRFDDDGNVEQQGSNVNKFYNENFEGALYAQDKWEYEGMVVNAGIRLEFFETGQITENAINNADVPKEVDEYKTNWSPRLGFAFPITDRDKFFFHYGRFTQWPSRTFLFATQDAIGNIGTLGNPDLGPELTVSYQAGVAHQFNENVAANFVVFSKDIYGLVSSTLLTDDSTGIQSFRFINKTYASARGLEISLEKRLTRRVGFEAYYTYSFADGVASDADFGRTANGLTHLPTEELPLNWDQRHTFNLTFRLQDRNNWGATAIYQFGSGLPWTPVDRFARLADPKFENLLRLEQIHRLSVQGRKKFNVYGRELTLFFEGRNLLDEDIPLITAPGAFPALAGGAGMDGGSYLTETGEFNFDPDNPVWDAERARFGGAYLQDIDGDGRDDFTAVFDPTIWEQHRIWRVGLGFEF